MKHLYAFAIALLLLPGILRAQDSPEDRYIAIYDLIQQADALSDAANMREALPKYKEAQRSLQKFQTDYPDWNTKIVKFRLSYLVGKINPLEDQSAGEISSKVNSAANAAAAVRPVVTAPTPAPVTAPTGIPDEQVRTLREQLRQAQSEKGDLERQLRTLPANTQPSVAEQQALAEAQDKIKSLQQENDRLKSGLKQSGGVNDETALMQRAAQALTDAKTKLAEQTRMVSVLTVQNATLQKRLEAVTVDTAGSGQVAALQQQLRDAEAERLALQAQVRDAHGGDADALSKAEERIKNLQKENNLLRASLERQPSPTINTADSFNQEQNKQNLADLNKKLQDQSDQIAMLVRDKDTLQKRLDSVVNTDALAQQLTDTKQQLTDTRKELVSTKLALKKSEHRNDIMSKAAEILLVEHKMKIRVQQHAAEKMMADMNKLRSEKGSGEDSEAVTALREENDTLRKQLADVRKNVDNGGSASDSTEELLTLQNKVAAVTAQLDVLQAKPTPYTEEELALFTKKEAPPASQTQNARNLPPGGAELVAEAQRLFATHHLEQAEDKYQQVLKLDPNNVWVLANLATIQIERENFVDAEQNLRRAMKIQPKDAFSLGVYGNMLFRLAKYDEALEALSQAAKLDPNSAEIQNVLGITLSHKGQRGAAEAALRKALQLDPNYGNAHNNLAVIYITQDPPLTELARWHYQKALSLGVGRNPDLEKLIETSPAEDAKPADDSAK